MKYAELIVKYYSEHTILIQGDYKTTIPIYGSQKVIKILGLRYFDVRAVESY